MLLRLYFERTQSPILRIHSIEMNNSVLFVFIRVSTNWDRNKMRITGEKRNDVVIETHCKPIPKQSFNNERVRELRKIGRKSWFPYFKKMEGEKKFTK